MIDLVFIQRDDVFTNSMTIAEGTGNEREFVTRIIRNYQNDFNYFGVIGYVDVKRCNEFGYKQKGRPLRLYQLNEPQATLLITYLKNTESARKFKLSLIKEFYAMRMILIKKKALEWLETSGQDR